MRVVNFRIKYSLGVLTVVCTFFLLATAPRQSANARDNPLDGPGSRRSGKRSEFVKTHPFAAERMEVVSKRPFAETVAAFERRIPVADVSAFVQLVTARATAAQIEQ